LQLQVTCVIIACVDVIGTSRCQKAEKDSERHDRHRYCNLYNSRKLVGEHKPTTQILGASTFTPLIQKLLRLLGQWDEGERIEIYS
jgi:hypothetical protein